MTHRKRRVLSFLDPQAASRRDAISLTFTHTYLYTRYYEDVRMCEAFLRTQKKK